jgi:hypothetical protein
MTAGRVIAIFAIAAVALTLVFVVASFTRST